LNSYLECRAENASLAAQANLLVCVAIGGARTKPRGVRELQPVEHDVVDGLVIRPAIDTNNGSLGSSTLALLGAWDADWSTCALAATELPPPELTAEPGTE
jgi:hypothetical protein